MIITLAKALKLKNSLTKEISELKQKVQNSNLQTDRVRNSYRSDEEGSKLTGKVDKLVELKTKIAQANAPIWESIFKIAEAKGLIETFNGMRIIDQDQIQYKPDGTEVVLSTKPYITEDQKAKMVKDYEAVIEREQDVIDAFNATTKIVIAD